MNTGSFSEANHPHLLSDVDCQGSEASLLQCQYSTTASCGPTEDAAAVCQGEYVRVILQSYITALTFTSTEKLPNVDVEQYA